VSFADATISRLPGFFKPYAQPIMNSSNSPLSGHHLHHRLGNFLHLKLTILDYKPVTAKVIAGIVAVIASYVLNREWSFRNRGGRDATMRAAVLRVPAAWVCC